MRDRRRRAAVHRPALLCAAAAVLAGCSAGGSGAQRAVPAASGAPLPSPRAAQLLGAAPAPAGPSHAPTALPAATGTATPAPYRPARRTSDAQAQIGVVYDTWMSDLSGLLGNLTQPWADAVREVATPKMTSVAGSAAGALLKAHDHTLGRLVDSRRVVRVSGATATLTDCLDELHWYVVEDASGRPDPSATRGYFVGTADLVLTSGRWYVSSWNSHPQPCAP